MLKCDFNKVASNFIEITFQLWCSVNLLYIFRTHFPKNTSGGLLLVVVKQPCHCLKQHLLNFLHVF